MFAQPKVDSCAGNFADVRAQKFDMDIGLATVLPTAQFGTPHRIFRIGALVKKFVPHNYLDTEMQWFRCARNNI